jgi:hypothetical protein
MSTDEINEVAKALHSARVDCWRALSAPVGADSGCTPAEHGGAASRLLAAGYVVHPASEFYFPRDFEDQLVAAEKLVRADLRRRDTESCLWMDGPAEHIRLLLAAVRAGR